MAAIQGKMFILVHVDRNRELVGDISSRLVADYGVPVSIVDDIQKFCPKCSGDAKQDIVPFTAASTSASEDTHDLHVISPTRPKMQIQATPRNVQLQPSPASQPRMASVFSSKHSLPQNQSKASPIPLKVVLAPPQPKTATVTAHRVPQIPSMKPLPKMLNGLQPTSSTPKTLMSNGHSSLQTPKREKSRNGTPEVMVPEKKLRFEEHLPKIKIEPTINLEEVEYNNEDIAGGESMDEAGDLATILAKLQNQACDFPSIGNGTGNSSDDNDNASISSNMYDDDEVPFNPDILTNFITSQQATDFFGHTSLDSLKDTKLDPKPMMVTQRQVPPMLTVNGKTRRGRIVYSAHELNILEDYYEKDPNACADPKKRETMCRMLSIDYHRLKVWFQNRRRKDKVRSQEDTSNTSNSHSPESIAEVL